VRCPKKTNKGLCDLCWFLEGKPQPESIQHILFDCPYAAPGVNAHRAFILATCSTAGQCSILSMSKSTFIATFTGRIVFGSTVTEDDMYHAPPDIIAQFSAAVLDAMLSRRTRNATQGPHAPPLSFDPNPILSTATTLFTRAAKSAHFLAECEEKRLSIMYHGWTPSPSPTDKWEAAWLESGAFCNTSTSRLTLRLRLPKQIEHIQGAFPSPGCLGEHSPNNAPNPAAPAGNGGGAWHQHQQTTNQHPAIGTLGPRQRTKSPHPGANDATQHTRGTPPSQPYTALPWWDGRSQPPYRHTTATFSIIPTHIHTPIGVQSLAPATSPHPTWLQGTNGHHAPNDTLASCTPPNAHIPNPHTGK